MHCAAQFVSQQESHGDHIHSEVLNPRCPALREPEERSQQDGLSRFGVLPEEDHVHIVSNVMSERRQSSDVTLPEVSRSNAYLAVHRFDNSVYYRRIEGEEVLLLANLAMAIRSSPLSSVRSRQAHSGTASSGGFRRASRMHRSSAGSVCPSLQGTRCADERTM